MERTCAFPPCGRTFEAKRSTAKFCGSSCRARASSGGVVALPARAAESDAPGQVLKATRAALEAVQREESPVGAAALALAERIDSGRDPAAGLAALSRELRATLEVALAAVPAASAVVRHRDELAARRHA